MRLNVTPDEEVEIARRQWDCDIGNEALARRYHSLLTRSGKISEISIIDPKAPVFPSGFGIYLLHKIIDRNSSTQPLLAYDYESDELVVFRWLRHEAFSLEDPARAEVFMVFFESFLKLSDGFPKLLAPKKWGTLGNRPFFTVPFFAGATLARFIEREQPSQKQCAEIVRELTTIIGRFHKQGKVHWRISVKTVLIRNSELRVMGLEKWPLWEQRRDWALSGAVLVPNLENLSPEQVKWDKSDKTSDVYQLGLIMYQLLTGRHPFHDYLKRPFRTLLGQILKGPEDPRQFAKDLSPELSKICMKALAQYPEQRYQSMDDFRRALDTYPL